MIENNPESAAGSCQETGAGGHAGNNDAPRERVEYGAPDSLRGSPGAPIDDESDACRCAQCGAAMVAPRSRPANAGLWPQFDRLPIGPMPSDYRSVAEIVQGALGAIAAPRPGRSTLEILYGAPIVE